MTDDGMDLVAVGVAHTPYGTPADAPHQGFADDAESEIEIHPEYADALAGVESYHRLTVLYWAHLADRGRAAGEAGGRGGETGGGEDGGGDEGGGGRRDEDDVGRGRDEDDICGGRDEDGAGDRDGAFARRGLDRPNPMAVCTCTVLSVDGRRIRVSGLDAVDGSPVVDLKPALQAER